MARGNDSNISFPAPAPSGGNTTGWPGRTLCSTKSFKDRTIDAAKNVAHQSQGFLRVKVGAVNVHPTDPGRKEAGTMDVPNVVFVGWRSQRQPAAAQSPDTKMFQP